MTVIKVASLVINGFDCKIVTALCTAVVLWFVLEVCPDEVLSRGLSSNDILQ